MELKNSKLLDEILQIAEEIKKKTGNKFLSKEQVLLAFFAKIGQAEKAPESDKELDEVITVAENSFSDREAAINALRESVIANKATSENSQEWINMLRNTTAISQQIQATNISAGILLQVILAGPPECIKSYLVAEAEAAEAKANSMFVQRLEDLKEADEFVEFVNEVRSLAPSLREVGTEEVLKNQAILFSAESDESAINTYLNMLNDLYNEEKLVDFTNPPAIVPISADTIMNSNIPSIEQFSLDKIDKMILCLDVSAWVGRMDSEAFQTFLLKCYQRQQDFVFVFRVPYLEKTVLNKIAVQIQDVFSLRIISFTPWSLNYMSEIAKNYIMEAGFEPDDEAMEAFRLRVREERADGRFYGYATIRKIADEMIYLKHKAMMKSENLNLAIKAEDLKALTQSRLHCESSDVQLQELVGSEEKKSRITKLFKEISTDKDGLKHMYFVGKPGTGKSRAAKIIGQYLKEQGVIAHGRYYEQALVDFVGECEGETMPLTMSIIRDAYGSVLLINELGGRGEIADYEDEIVSADEDCYDEFERDAVNTLMMQMEFRKKDFIVIFAGTEEEISQFESKYPDIKKLVPHRMDFDGFEKNELLDIFMDLLSKNKLTAGDGLKEAVMTYLDIVYDDCMNNSEFTNARYMTNLFEHAVSKATVRAAMDGSDAREILPCDFMLAAKDSSVELNIKKKGNHVIGF